MKKEFIKRGTETIHSVQVSNTFILIVKNHNPRKGTETSCLDRNQYSHIQVKNHNPRKGTETLRNRFRMAKAFFP